MYTETIKTEPTKAGLKIYYPLSDGKWGHIKTTKNKYEPMLRDLLWIKDYKKIIPTKEERMYLEMKFQIWSIDWANSAQREFVNRYDVVSVAKVNPRNLPTYYVVIMEYMGKHLEVVCSKAVYTLAIKLGYTVPTINRLQ